MKLLTTATLALLVSAGVYTAGCSHEVAHSEKDSPTWTGGHKHEETTTYQNPDGTRSTEHSESKSSQ